MAEFLDKTNKLLILNEIFLKDHEYWECVELAEGKTDNKNE